MPFMNNIKELCLVPGKASGDIASFEAADAPLVSCICTLNPVQAGSGEPSPTNVRPISGWSGCNVNVFSHNIWNEEWRNGYYGTSGEFISDSNYVACKDLIPIRPNMSMYAVIPVIHQVCWYDSSGHFISKETTAYSSKVYTSPSNAYYMTFYLGSAYGSTYNNDISINYPSTDTSYHAYNGSSHTITFPDTVYGASLDVGSGVLKDNRGIEDLGNLSYIYYPTEQVFRCTAFAGKNNNIICSCYKTNSSYLNWEDMPNNTIQANATDLVIKNTDYSDATAFKTAMTGQKVVYELATPTTTQLTPEQLNSILGENNFYHDGNGPIDITYIRRMN